MIVLMRRSPQKFSMALSVVQVSRASSRPMRGPRVLGPVHELHAAKVGRPEQALTLTQACGEAFRLSVGHLVRLAAQTMLERFETLAQRLLAGVAVGHDARVRVVRPEIADERVVLLVAKQRRGLADAGGVALAKRLGQAH